MTKITKADYVTSVTDVSKPLFKVTGGPQKGLTGYAVNPAEVGGVTGMVYIRSGHDGMVYEISPKFVVRM